ncbi:MAG TPA: ABC transporter permease [Polyangia bacterium]|jgi:molybdate transport system permease protein|nr:ABC transporter permease [Polyangia bacterium]
MSWLQKTGFRGAMGAAAFVFALFLLAPVVALLLTSGPGEIARGLGHPIVGPALTVSLITTTVSLVIVLLGGTPLAWWVARSDGRAARWIDTLVQLPIVIPPAVSGIALLFAFGRRGIFGSLLDSAGLSVAFTGAAVVMAQVFVGAPFYVQAAAVAFRHLDRSLLAVAKTLGAQPARMFFRIALPLAAPSLIAGAAMSWARALGEFGATLMFAGNLQGKTQTLPLAIYTALESDLGAARALSVLLIVVAFALLLVLRRWPRTRVPGFLLAQDR